MQMYLNLFVRPPQVLYTVPGYLNPVEGKFLYWRAQCVPAGGLAVEVGSFKGKSSGFIAAGLPPGARLACVDTWKNDAMPYDAADDSFPEFRKHTAAYQALMDAHRGTSAQVAAAWTLPIDLLFIDGDHSYEGCSEDLKAWIGFVRRDGWIAVHDSSVEGVKRSIAEFFPAAARYSELRAWSIFAARKR
jgi:predicted O-methyltransferase YrrM